MLDVKEALRDVMIGIRTPARWLRDEETLAQMDEDIAQKQATAEMIDMAQKGWQGAESISRSIKTLGEAGVA
jgi:hypothetical protein